MSGLVDVITKIRRITDRKSKIWIAALIVFTLFVSIVETLGLSSLMLFISIVIDPRKIVSNRFLQSLYSFFNVSTSKNFIYGIGVLFILLYLFRFVTLIVHVYFVQRYSFRQYRVIALSLYTKYMEQPYKDFVFRNSSALTKNILHEAQNFSSLVWGLINLLTEFLSLTFIYIILLFVKWKLTLVLTLTGVIFVSLVGHRMSSLVKHWGKIRYRTEQDLYKSMMESFGSFKTLKFVKHIDKSVAQFNQTFKEYSASYMNSNVLAAVPKNLFEVSGFIIVIMLIFYIMYRYNDYGVVLSVVSIYVIALYKFLPGLHRSITYYNQAIFLYSSLDNIYIDLKKEYPREHDEPLQFSKALTFENVCFSYVADRPVLRNVNLVINKGDKVAFIGESGAGKTTVVDIFCGLLIPDSGKIWVDDALLASQNIIDWRSRIGYIPQAVYLFDGTVAENVALAVDYNETYIINALKLANVYDFLLGKEGLHTRVGDNGVQLSGGQKQRIAIARALYKNPDILVMDEATAALDSKTEEKVIEEIFKVCKDRTLIVIAHRLSTIEGCNKVFVVENGHVRARDFAQREIQDRMP